MTFEQAKPIVKEILENTPVSEQARLLAFFHSPKAEPFLQPLAIKFKSKKRGPSGDDSERSLTMAVATGRI